MACIKIVELIGCSGDSFEGAVKEAFEKAKKTVRNITGIKVVGQNVKIKNNEIKEYRVNVKVAFEIE